MTILQEVYGDMPFRVGEIVFFPHVNYYTKRPMLKNVPEVQKLQRMIIKNTGYTEKECPFAAERFLIDNYDKKLHVSKIEPEWINLLSKNSRLFIRNRFAQMNDDGELCLDAKLPLMPLRYMVSNGGILGDTMRALNLFRLCGVRQLAYLHDPVVRSIEITTVTTPFPHTRYQHHLDTAMYMALIIENNKVLEPYRNLLMCAAVSHDGKTPAFGDATKLIDLETFDEETRYCEYFETKEWKELRAKYSLDEELLYQTICGKGMLGKVLDIADKLAYVTRDTLEYLHKYERSLDSAKYYAENENYRAISDVIRRKSLRNIWAKIKVYNGDVYFTNSTTQADFFLWRSLLFKEIYYNPCARWPEYMVYKFVAKALYENHSITQPQLSKLTDDLLEHIVNDFAESPYFLSLLRNAFVAVETPASLEAAKERQVFWNAQGYVALIDDFQTTTNPGFRKFLVRKGGKNFNLQDLEPAIVAEIQENMSFVHPPFVCVFKSEHLKNVLAHNL